MSKFCPKHGDPKELPHTVDHCTCEFPINLIGELIAVRPDLVEGTIKLPDWKRNLSGLVLATAPGARDVRVGDRVLFGAAVGMDSVLQGEAIRILKYDDIDLVYEA